MVNVARMASRRRQQAELAPDNARVARAAVLLDRLASDVAVLNGSELHSAIYLRWQEADFEAFAECVGGCLSEVGFLFFPTNGRELLERVLAIAR
jgi:hypothetical protein